MTDTADRATAPASVNPARQMIWQDDSPTLPLTPGWFCDEGGSHFAAALRAKAGGGE